MNIDPRVGLIGDAEATGSSLLESLATTKIVIRIARKCEVFGSVRLAASRALDLLARLFDNVSIEIEGDTIASWVKQENLRAGMIRERAVRVPVRTLIVGIGEVDADVHVGMTGWSVLVSRAGAPMVGEGLIAGCLAGPIIAAEAFKSVFRETLRTAVFKNYSFNALNYATDPTIDAPIKDLVLDTILIGCGSIGFGFIDALRSLPLVVHGSLTLVDNGAIEKKNVFKYSHVLSADAISGRDKVDVLAGWLVSAHTDLAVERRPYVVKDVTDIIAATAVIAPDNLSARREGQEMLSKDVVNAAIAGTNVDIASLRFGKTGCIYCYYNDSPGDSIKYPSIAALTGKSIDWVERAYIDNRPLTREDTTAISREAYFAGADLSEFVGQPLRSLMQRPFYSQTQIALPGEKPVPVSTAFVSAFAGALALVETIKLAVPELEPYRLAQRMGWDLMGTFKSSFVLEEPRRPSCAICTSRVRLEVHAERWAS